MGDIIIVLFEIDVLLFLTGSTSVLGWIVDHFNI